MRFRQAIARILLKASERLDPPHAPEPEPEKPYDWTFRVEHHTEVAPKPGHLFPERWEAHWYLDSRAPNRRIRWRPGGTSVELWRMDDYTHYRIGYFDYGTDDEAVAMRTARDWFALKATGTVDPPLKIWNPRRG